MQPNDVLVILGGCIVKDERGTWKTASFREGDAFGITGDSIRVIAGSIFHQKNPLLKIIVSGGKGQLKNAADAPPVADILKRELVDFGVPAERISEERGSGTTYEQLSAAARLASEMNATSVCILSNRYHLPRIEAMIRYAPGLQALKNARLIAAEDVVIADNPKKWRTVIEEAYASETMQKRIEAEERGVCDIREGKYRFADDESALRFRKATIEDARRLFEWRNDPDTRANSLNTAPIKWDMHTEWLSKSLANPNRILLIAEDNGTQVGTVRIDIHENGEHELSWTVAPEARGKGIGKRMVRDAAIAYGKPLMAQIKNGHRASEKVAEYAGFVLKERRDEFSLWKYPAND